MTQNPYGLAAVWSQGDLVTKSVALLLLAMSVASWYLIATRAWRLFKLRRASRSASEFWHSRTFAEGMAAIDVGGSFNPFKHLALEGQAAASHHAHSKDDLHGQLTLAEWLTESLRGAIDDCAERMNSGLYILASVASTAPFVGLFGTVWGIYHALVGIGASGQAGIDKVAGPVGEALIMTAFGLVVAIPAVLGYNTLTRGNKTVIGKLHRFARQLHAYFLTGSPVDANAKPLELAGSLGREGR
jgi:biopolymer transport protein ExbB